MCLCCKITKKICCIIIVLALIALVALGIILFFFVFTGDENTVGITTPILTVEVLREFMHIHDPHEGQNITNAVTEVREDDTKRIPYSLSFFFTEDDKMIQSMGKKGESTLREFNLESGATTRFMNLNKAFNGQGSAIIIDPETSRVLVAQVTLDDKIVIFYDLETLQVVNRLSLDLNAVGATSNITIKDTEESSNDVLISKQKLWLSNNSETIFEVSIPSSIGKAVKLDIKKKIVATCVGFLLRGLGDIVYNDASASIFAAVNPHELIAEISIKSGQCMKVITLEPLFKSLEESKQAKAQVGKDEYFTSVAIQPSEKAKAPKFFVTGKLWKNIFHIKITGNGETSVLNALRAKGLPLNL